MRFGLYPYPAEEVQLSMTAPEPSALGAYSESASFGMTLGATSLLLAAILWDRHPHTAGVVLGFGSLTLMAYLGAGV